MKNTLSDKRVMIIAPNNCSPDYRITKSYEMVKKFAPNVSLVRMVDVKKELHEIEMARDIETQSYGTTLETLSELRFFSHINFIFYLLFKTFNVIAFFYRVKNKIKIYITLFLSIAFRIPSKAFRILSKAFRILSKAYLIVPKAHRGQENRIKRKVKI